MPKINFFLKDKKKERTPIEAIVRYAGNRYKVATGLSVEVQYWDNDSHRCFKRREYPDHEVINIKLGQIEAKLQKLFSDYEYKGIVPASEQFRADYTGKEKNVSGLAEMVISHIDKSSYSEQTSKKYMTLHFWIQKYEKKCRVKLQSSDIDLEWYRKFKAYFESQTYTKKVGGVEETRHYSLNYFGSLIKCLKVVLVNAGKELSISDDLSDKNFKTEAEESDSIYLSEDEVKLLVNYEPTLEDAGKFTNEKRLHNLTRKVESWKLVKTWFLIGCYTALRVSDFTRVDLVNVKKGTIRIAPKKGSKKNSTVVIPIHPVVQSIIDSGFDFNNRISDVKINKHIKEIYRVLGLNEEISVIRTEGGKEVERIYPKWQLVTTHTARRSGATNMYKAGIPAISIMKITGHRTEKSFLKYIKISAEENAEMLANHPFFMK